VGNASKKMQMKHGASLGAKGKPDKPRISFWFQQRRKNTRRTSKKDGPMQNGRAAILSSCIFIYRCQHGVCHGSAPLPKVHWPKLLGNIRDGVPGNQQESLVVACAKTRVYVTQIVVLRQAVPSSEMPCKRKYLSCKVLKKIRDYS